MPLGSARPTRPDCFSPGGVLPGSSSRDGGLEELRELRDSRCSTRASLPASFSLASTNSEICPAIAVICPAWRRTTAISSSRDISSGARILRSHRDKADHQARHAETAQVTCATAVTHPTPRPETRHLREQLHAAGLTPRPLRASGLPIRPEPPAGSLRRCRKRIGLQDYIGRIAAWLRMLGR